MPIERILICDDDSERIVRWEKQIGAKLPDAEIRPITGIELAQFVRALDDEEQRVRGGVAVDPAADRSQLALADWADLVFVDSDLSPQMSDLDEITDSAARKEVALILRNGYGNAVARQLRSYTNTGLLVVVNMFWGKHPIPRVFDLTLTQAAYSSGDLHIRQAEIENDGTWMPIAGDVPDPYLPWQRPPIGLLFETFVRSRETPLELDALLFETLGIDPSKLTAKQLDVFEQEASAVTFDDLLSGPLGFKYPEAPHPDEARQRMVRSAVRRWLERIVVPAQNVIVDAPHLFERYWRLLGEDPARLELWNATRNFTWDESDSLPAGSALRVDLSPFLVRPAYDEDLARRSVVEMGEGARPSGETFSAAFAEDTSTFHPLEDLETFPTDVSGPFGRRWVRRLDGVGYEPSNRLLL